MNEIEKPKRVSPTASEYIDDNFKASDRIAILAAGHPPWAIIPPGVKIFDRMPG